MKRFAFLLALALLLCLAACGSARDVPEITTTQATATAVETTVEIYEAPRDNAEELYFDIFRPAFELSACFTMTTAANYEEKSVRRSGVYYYLATDPRFSSFAAMEATLRGMFSEEIARKMMNSSPFKYPLYIEHKGEVYGVGGRGFPIAMPSLFSIEEQSGDKVTYRVRVVSMNGEKDYIYVRELINGKWIFTEFPMDWMKIAG